METPFAIISTLKCGASGFSRSFPPERSKAAEKAGKEEKSRKR